MRNCASALSNKTYAGLLIEIIFQILRTHIIKTIVAISESNYTWHGSSRHNV